MLAPLGKPAAATALAQMQAQAESHRGDSGIAMAEMPCCPDEIPVPDCVKHCLMLFCAAPTVPMLLVEARLFAPIPSAVQVSPTDERFLVGFALDPPIKPPQV
jgi:hypothetical protein